MNQPDTGSYEHFEALRESAREAARRGQLEEALVLCDEAMAWAETHGEKTDRDLALCNRHAILITCEQTEGVGGALRRTLMGSAEPMVRFLASYNLSRLHLLEREAERGLFYARLARELSERLGNHSFEALASNQVGSLLLLDCQFEEALSNYEQLLAGAYAQEDTERAIILSNAGYCHVMLDRHRSGFVRLFESLRLMQRKKAGSWKVLPHLGLSYAYLDLRKFEVAGRHARRALEHAEILQNRDYTMNALYLLGEAEKLRGQELAAFECFKRLQRDFHPDQPSLTEFLMATDVRPLVNLMA